MGSFRNTGMGKKKTTPRTLKTKCARAMLIVCSPVVSIITAIKAVMVVPTFAPIMKGAACRKVVILFATMGTTTEVVIVLDLIAAVVSTPHEKDLNGCWKKNLLKASGDPAFNRFEMILLNNSIERNSKTNDKAARIAELPMWFKMKFVSESKGDHVSADSTGVALLFFPNIHSAITVEVDDRKP